MEFKISKEALEQLGSIIEQVPTKWGIPITQLLQENIKPLSVTPKDSTSPAPSVLSWGQEGVNVSIYKGKVNTNKTTTTTGVVKTGTNGEKKTKLANGVIISLPESDFNNGKEVEVKGYTYVIN